MSLKYRDRPQLSYAPGYSGPENPQSRLPPGAQPIRTAPERSGQAVLVYERDGAPRWALNHQGAWRELKPYRDHRDGTTQWRMDNIINNPVAWAYPPKGT